MALLRAGDISILSTNKGYLLLKENETTRVFKVHHTQDQARQEMNLIVDCGGKLAENLGLYSDQIVPSWPISPIAGL